MKKQTILIISILILSTSLWAQNTIDKILTEIEQNNTTLIALRKSVEADKIGNKTGLSLANPEFEFAYLWGSPAVIGNRTNISIKQSFDFPTAYKFKNQISDIKNEQAELEYVRQQKELFLQTKSICFDLIYTNALKAELSKRLNHAKSIANAYQRKLDIGEANILEHNKAQLNLLNLQKELEALEIEKTVFLSQLKSLNGGVSIDFADEEFEALELSPDFEQWYATAQKSNPILNWLKQELALNQTQEQLTKAQALPKFQAGYMSEALSTEKFQGVVVGLTLPLWENKNKVKHVQAQTMALESIEADRKLQFYTHLNTLHTKVYSLQNSLKQYRTQLLVFNSSELLMKALDQGEISLIDYMLELSIYYESVNTLLEMERDLNKTYAELNQFI
jgi:outer membrane protein TolC